MFKVLNHCSKENLFDAVFYSNENIYILDYEQSYYIYLKEEKNYNSYINLIISEYK